MIVTRKDVAQHAQVSESTAGMILAGRGQRYSVHTREKVLAAAKALDYRPNPGRAEPATATFVLDRRVDQCQQCFNLHRIPPRRASRFEFRRLFANRALACRLRRASQLPPTLRRSPRGRLDCQRLARFLRPIRHQSIGGRRRARHAGYRSLRPLYFRRAADQCRQRRRRAMSVEHLLGLGHRRIAMLSTGPTTIPCFSG